MTLAIAYPLFSGATIALMVLAGALFFGERISATMIVGCGVIVLGIALVARQ
ncbi:MAG: SMR family transporter [Burkholderiales bacterium]